jgi:hypothetical protein
MNLGAQQQTIIRTSTQTWGASTKHLQSYIPLYQYGISAYGLDAEAGHCPSDLAGPNLANIAHPTSAYGSSLSLWARYSKFKGSEDMGRKTNLLLQHALL